MLFSSIAQKHQSLRCLLTPIIDVDEEPDQTFDGYVSTDDMRV